jgi:hypothetical protein
MEFNVIVDLEMIYIRLITLLCLMSAVMRGVDPMTCMQKKSLGTK